MMRELSFELWREEFVLLLREVEELDNRVFLNVHPNWPVADQIVFPFVTYRSVSGTEEGSFGGEAAYPVVRLEVWDNDAVRIDRIVRRCLGEVAEMFDRDPTTSTDYYVQEFHCHYRAIMLQLRSF